MTRCGLSCQKAGEDAAVGGLDGAGLIDGADDQAGIEDVGEELLERARPMAVMSGPTSCPWP